MAQGNTFLSVSCGVFPSSQTMQTQVKAPLAVVVRPLAEAELPKVTYGTNPIVRCQNCQGYISPFTVFRQEGRVWICALCANGNPVPDYFYAPVLGNGLREDAETRTELVEMAYDILAPEEYMVRPPMPPTYCFVIDVSQAARVSGMTSTLCDVLVSLLDSQSFPGLPRTQLSILLYGHEVHLLGFPCDNGPIRLYTVGKSSEDLFLPVPIDELLVSVEGNEQAIRQCAEVIRKMNAETCQESSAVRTALAYGRLILGNSGGKVLLFAGESNAQDAGQYSTETKVNPVDTYYHAKASEFVSAGVTVDLFLSATRFCSLYSISDLAKYTSGKIFFYPEMSSSQSLKFQYELWTHITQDTVWETKFRLRVSRDWRVGACYGHFSTYDSVMQSMPSLHPAHTLTFDLSLAVTLASSASLHLQAALLYTTSDGDRRVRVINGKYPLSHSLKEIYLSTDSEVIAAVWSKRALMHMTASNRLDTGKTYIEHEISSLYSSYLLFRTSEDSDPLAFLPALTLGYLKLPVFNGLVSGYHLDFDTACWQRSIITLFSAQSLSLFAYPRLYSLSNPAFSPLPLTKSSLNSDDIYLLDEAWQMQLWIESLFGFKRFDGVSFPTEANISTSQGEIAVQTREFIESQRMSIGFYQLLRVVKSQDALETLYWACRFLRQMVEDSTRVPVTLTDFVQSISSLAGEAQRHVD